MINKQSRNEVRKRRHRRVRRKVSGTAARPRLNVFRSSRHIYAQIIDDQNGRTVVAASSLDSGLKEETAQGATREAAKKVGAALARRALDKGVREVVFDRGGYIFHGRVKALADGAREQGLIF
ncbi:MAG: 50S ribosomal protein L18 [Dethiobacter sp.]|jgi:large subunit ribosomal protein L18|nr:50S ribosomal protein L18 [Dethiobacter sp.]